MAPPLAAVFALDETNTGLLKIMRDDPCPYCGHKMVPETRRAPTKEHLTPRSRTHEFAGGDNLVMVCAACNNRKGDLTLLEFLFADGLRQGELSRSYRRDEPPVKRFSSPQSAGLPETVPVLIAFRLMHAAEDHFGAAMWVRSAKLPKQALAWVAWQLAILPKSLIDVLKNRGMDASAQSLEHMACAFAKKLDTPHGRAMLAVWLPKLQERGFRLPTPLRPAPVQYSDGSRHQEIRKPPVLTSFPFTPKAVRTVGDPSWPRLEGILRPLVGQDDDSAP